MRRHTSTAERVLSAAWGRSRTAVWSSTVARWVERGIDRITDVGRRSRVAETLRRVGRTARTAWFYRWLTVEPDPDVVVIDLRETWTVGPVLALLDAVLAPLQRHWKRAAFRTFGIGLAERFVARPVAVTGTVVATAILVNLLFLIGLGSPHQPAVGWRLIAMSVAIAGTRVTVPLDDLLETRPVELLAAILAPPEPPAADQQGER